MDSIQINSHVSIQEGKKSEDSKVTVSIQNTSQKNPQQDNHENPQEKSKSKKSSSFNLNNLKQEIDEMKELMNEGFQSIKDELSKISQSLSLILSHKSPDNSSVKKTDA